jgi:enoyl-CoA hydratase
MRNTPDALRFIGLAAREGVGAVIAERDRPFADYSQGTPQEQPRPPHVIHPPRR